MAARWMQPKLAKQVSERREATARANDRANWETIHRPKHDVPADELVRQYIEQGGTITRCDDADVRHYTDVGLMGKTKRRYDKRVYGNGKRTTMRTHGVAFRPEYR